MKKNTQCYFEANNITHIDYKDVATLKKFTNAHGRILPSGRTGTTARNQRKLAQAVKRARFMGLMPYIQS
tara:strand:+ start:562 stop:771 length:210 start_codon:yes stop_codon:yes gene_type:complete